MWGEECVTPKCKLKSKKFTWVDFAPKYTFYAPWRKTYQKKVFLNPPNNQLLMNYLDFPSCRQKIAISELNDTEMF